MRVWLRSRLVFPFGWYGVTAALPRDPRAQESEACHKRAMQDRLEAVRESDAILREEFAKNGLEGKVCIFTAICPISAL